MITEQMRADGWIEHDGGPCPVAQPTRVHVMFRDGTIRCGGGKGFNSSTVAWSHAAIGSRYPELHIIAYRPEPKP